MYDLGTETPKQKLDRLVMDCWEMLAIIEREEDPETRKELQEIYDEWALEADKTMRFCS